jgi:hypothetical protein
MLGSVLSSALDTVLDDGGGDDFGGDLAADMFRLTEDDTEPTTSSSSGKADTSASVDGGTDLITPGMLMKTPTTTVHGMTTASIWGAPAAVSTAPRPTSAELPRASSTAASVQQPPSQSMSLADLEAQLRASAVAVPAPLGPPQPVRPRGPPGLAARPAVSTSTTQQAPPPVAAVVHASNPPTESKEPRKSEERASSWKKPDEGVVGAGASGSPAKATPILAKLKQQQGEHALMQKKMVEVQRFEIEMKQLGSEIDAAKTMLLNHQRAIHTIRVQMSQMGPTADPAKVRPTPSAHTDGYPHLPTYSGICLVSPNEILVAYRPFRSLTANLDDMYTIPTGTRGPPG